MKNAMLLVGVFLMGISTQANEITVSENYNPWDNYDLYLSAQSVKFYENGILFEVFLDGSFSYALPSGTNYNSRDQVIRSRDRRMLPLNNRANRSNHNLPFNIDRFGVLHSVGRTQILYQRNGLVKRIGRVRMLYLRGRLAGVGGMDIFYGRHGNVNHTLGHINRLNIIHGANGVTTATHYGQRFFGHSREYGYGYQNRRRSANPNQGDDWNDAWDDDDDRNGHRSRN